MLKRLETIVFKKLSSSNLEKKLIRHYESAHCKMLYFSLREMIIWCNSTEK